MAKSTVKKLRADLLLLERGLCRDEEEARTLILAGKVRSGADHLVAKSSEIFPFDAELSVSSSCPFVSRGAYKLIPALEAHLPDLSGLVAMDIGASTGGFSDVMLQRGARKVYAIDSGRGQLHAKLRGDPRVISLEKCNARHLSTGMFPEKADLLTMDVSFISATKILPAVSALLKAGAWAFILVKPQFEAERRDVAAGGVVRDEAVRQACVEKVATFAERELGWCRIAVMRAEITGPKGNQEFMAVFRTGGTTVPFISRLSIRLAQE